MKKWKPVTNVNNQEPSPSTPTAASSANDASENETKPTDNKSSGFTTT